MCFPLIRKSRKRAKDKPWVTKGTKISIKHRHRLLRLSINHPTPNNVYKYHRYRNILTQTLQNAEVLHFKNILDDFKRSSYNIWRALNPIINPRKKAPLHILNKIVRNGQAITEGHAISESFNEYFCNIGHDLQNAIPKSSNSYRDFLPERVSQTFYLMPVTTEDIVKEIQSLNPRKSSGPDNIGPKIIQLCPHIFAENLVKMFNNSIEKGEYPTILKIAKVMALFKKGENYVMGNYRPISLLSCFNKIFEKILVKQLRSFIEKHNILYMFQFGFRPIYSTTLALIEFIDRVRRLMDQGNYVLSIFIDFTKAFDTVDHDILLDKMDRIGIRGHANDFFRTYLKTRQQYTEINGCKSSLRNVSCGVPQGSVLGPLFFLIYINDLYRAVCNDSVLLFADDTSLSVYNQKLNAVISKAKSQFSNLLRWCICNKLTINYDKTYFVLFHARNKSVPIDFGRIVIDGIVINRAKSVKYIGMIIDENLNWNEHVNSLCKSLLKYFGIFNKIKNFISNKIARQLYFAFIYSRINYGI